MVKELTPWSLIIVQIQSPYLWRVSYIIEAPLSNPTGNKKSTTNEDLDENCIFDLVGLQLVKAPAG